LAANYSTVSEGDFAAVFNSWDLLEIALNRDNAQKKTGAKIGDKVEINFDA
jgi:S-adenosylmethionine hydrolase